MSDEYWDLGSKSIEEFTTITTGTPTNPGPTSHTDTDSIRPIYPVGTPVYLRDTSRYYAQAPNHTPGRVMLIDQTLHLPHEVRWINGSIYHYGYEDLVSATKIPSTAWTIGMQVRAIHNEMHHFGCSGTIYKIEDTKIWIEWDIDHDKTCVSEPNRSLVLLEYCPGAERIQEECITCDHLCAPKMEEVTTLRKIQVEALKRKRIHEEKMTTYRKIITISSVLNNFLHKELKEYCNAAITTGSGYPFMYALGQDKEGVITTVYPLRGTDGCKDMQNISGYEINKAIVYFAKKKLMVVGIGRVGRFIDKDTFGIGELYGINPDAILLSLNNTPLMWAASLAKIDADEYDIIFHNLVIKKKMIKRKGVNKDAKTEESSQEEGHHQGIAGGTGETVGD